MKKNRSRFISLSISQRIAQYLLALSLLLSVSGFTQAAYYPSFHSPFDFSLRLSKTDLELQADGVKQAVSLDRVSFVVFTLIEPQVQFGFITGSSNLSVDDDPATAGMHLSGYHAGLAMRSHIGSNPQLGLHANYLYQETKDETTTQSATLSWHEWQAGINGRLILGQQLELSAGWTHADVDARRRASGTINETKSLALKSTSQTNLGIAWLTRDGGRVGLSLQRGSYQQVEFGFSRQFR